MPHFALRNIIKDVAKETLKSVFMSSPPWEPTAEGQVSVLPMSSNTDCNLL